MDNQIIRKLYYLGGTAPMRLLPSLAHILLISATILALLNGYQDYRYQLGNAFNNEAQAEEELKQSSRAEKEILILQKSFSELFRPPQQQASVNTDPKQRYALANNNLTNEFFMSCPTAELEATVVGLLTGDPDANDIAIIAYQGKESSYRVSDQLEKGINIVRIFPDRAIVNMHGYCAALLMN